MKIVIPRHRFLKNLSLMSCNPGFSWTNVVDEKSYVLGDPQNIRSISPVFELLSREEPHLISPKTQKALGHLGANLDTLPVDGVQSSQQMIEKIKESFKLSREALEELRTLGYIDTLWSAIVHSRGSLGPGLMPDLLRPQ